MMNLVKQFREFGVMNSINPLPPDAQVLWYNLMQCFNTSRWSSRKLVVRTQTLENLCGMTRKKLMVSRNTLIQRGLINYYPARQASGSPSYEINYLYENDSSVFPTETQEGTHRGTQDATQNGTHREHLLKTKPNETKLTSKSHSGDTPVKEKKTIEHWKTLVDYWFSFYETKFQAKPTFNKTAAASLKSIMGFIKKNASEKSHDQAWTEEFAKRCLERFLNLAYEDNWLKANFLLNNLSSKYDSITNSKTNGNGNKNTISRPVITGTATSAGGFE